MTKWLVNCLVFLNFMSFSLADMRGQVALPQFVVGSGVESVLLVSNRLPFELQCWVIAEKGSGKEAWAGPLWVNGNDISDEGSVEFRLPPLGSVKLVFQGAEELQVGYLLLMVMDPGQYPQDLAVTFFYNFYNAQQELIDSVAMAPCSLHEGFTVPVEKSDTINTGIAIVPYYNAWHESYLAQMLFTLYDSDGNEVESKDHVVEGHSAVFFTEIFESVPPDFVGMMHIQSKDPIYLGAIRLEHSRSGYQYTGVMTVPEYTYRTLPIEPSKK